MNSQNPNGEAISQVGRWEAGQNGQAGTHKRRIASERRCNANADLRWRTHGRDRNCSQIKDHVVPVSTTKLGVALTCMLESEALIVAYEILLLERQ